MLEREYRVSPLSYLFDARNELRKYPTLENELIERILELPEDDFCHHARESLQLGAGYALIRLTNDLDFVLETRHTATNPESLINALDMYFSIQPRNRYEPADTANERRKNLSNASLARTYSRPQADIEARVDPYELNALTAFTDGYMIVIHRLNVLDGTESSRNELT